MGKDASSVKKYLIRMGGLLAGGIAAGVGCTLGQQVTVRPSPTAYAQSPSPALISAPAETAGRSTDEENTIRAVRQVSPAVVKVLNTTAGGIGTGVIIDGKNGIILTNAHVVRRASTVVIKLKNAKTVPGRVVGSDTTVDIAVIKVDVTGLPEAPLGNSDRIDVGQTAIAIGNPLDLEQTVTKGVVSALNRHISPDDVEGFIQTDAAINPGNSGGPLLDSQGRVIGINSAVLRSSGAEGLGLAVPINVAHDVANQVLTSGRVQRVQMGVYPVSITPEMAEAYSFPVQSGVLIYSVSQESPAYQAGIRPGDIVVRLDNTDIDGRGSFLHVLRSKSPGDVVTATVLRPSGKTSIAVRLASPRE
jgi:serine protease Do